MNNENTRAPPQCFLKPYTRRTNKCLPACVRVRIFGAFQCNRATTATVADVVVLFCSAAAAAATLHLTRARVALSVCVWSFRIMDSKWCRERDLKCQSSTTLRPAPSSPHNGVSSCAVSSSAILCLCTAQSSKTQHSICKTCI